MARANVRPIGGHGIPCCLCSGEPAQPATCRWPAGAPAQPATCRWPVQSAHFEGVGSVLVPGDLSERVNAGLSGGCAAVNGAAKGIVDGVMEGLLGEMALRLGAEGSLARPTRAALTSSAAFTSWPRDQSTLTRRSRSARRCRSTCDHDGDGIERDGRQADDAERTWRARAEHVVPSTRV